MRIIVFPLRFRAWRNGQMMKLVVEHCNKEIAPKLREYHELRTAQELRSELFKRDMLKAHASTLKSLQLSPWKSLTPIPVSVPLFLSVAAGLRAIDYVNEGFGVIWSNFGEAGIYSAVPVFLSNFLYIEISRRRLERKNMRNGGNDSVDTSLHEIRRPFWKTKLPFIIGHTLNTFSFALLTQVPSGVNLFLFTSSLLSLIETKYLDFKADDPKQKYLFLKKIKEKTMGAQGPIIHV